MPQPASQPDDGAIIHVEKFRAAYGGKTVLQDVSFDVKRGEVLVLAGGSGCGKSTVLKHMIGLYHVRRGDARATQHLSHRGPCGRAGCGGQDDGGGGRTSRDPRRRAGAVPGHQGNASAGESVFRRGASGTTDGVTILARLRMLRPPSNPSSPVPVPATEGARHGADASRDRASPGSRSPRQVRAVPGREDHPPLL